MVPKTARNCPLAPNWKINHPLVPVSDKKRRFGPCFKMKSRIWSPKPEINARLVPVPGFFRKIEKEKLNRRNRNGQSIECRRRATSVRRDSARLACWAATQQRSASAPPSRPHRVLQRRRYRVPCRPSLWPLLRQDGELPVHIRSGRPEHRALDAPASPRSATLVVGLPSRRPRRVVHALPCRDSAVARGPQRHRAERACREVAL